MNREIVCAKDNYALITVKSRQASLVLSTTCKSLGKEKHHLITAAGLCEYYGIEDYQVFRKPSNETKKLVLGRKYNASIRLFDEE